MVDVVGSDEVIAKQSAVNELGKLRCALIAGVQFRPTRPVPHEDGHVTEVARASWDVLGGPVVQVHTTTTFQGRIRAWGLHQVSTDRLFVVSGLVKIVIFDGRNGSPTYGRINELVVSEKNPGLLIIPPNLYHGWKNLGITEAITSTCRTTCITMIRRTHWICRGTLRLHNGSFLTNGDLTTALPDFPRPS